MVRELRVLLPKAQPARAVSDGEDDQVHQRDRGHAQPPGHADQAHHRGAPLGGSAGGRAGPGGLPVGDCVSPQQAVYQADEGVQSDAGGVSHVLDYFAH